MSENNGLSHEQEIELQTWHKWNFDGVTHEFNLLHTRTWQCINSNWLLVALYVPVLVFTLGNIHNQLLKYFTYPVLALAAIAGVVVSATTISGITQAITAIKRYLQNQRDIHEQMGNDSRFVRYVTLGRKPDTVGNYPEHESSLRFHRVLPWFLISFWILLAVFSVCIIFIQLPVPSADRNARVETGLRAGP